jgi:hypothetical protein
MSTLASDPNAVYTMGEHSFVAYRPEKRSPEAVVERARAFHEELDKRRSVRMFTSDPVPRAAIEFAVPAASTAPSGAHQEPWTWVIVGDPETKHKMRIAAEEEGRASTAADLLEGVRAERAQGGLRPRRSR